MRTVELNLGEEWAEVVGPTASLHAQQQAVGYLALWCHQSIPRVRISGEPDGSMEAFYTKANGSMAYLIFALFDKDKGTWSFHS